MAVDEETPLEIEDVLLTAGNLRGESDHPYRLQIVLTPDEATHLEGETLLLAGLNGGHQVGVARLNEIVGRWVLSEHEVHELPRRTLPDPTITAAVEFVISEARYAQKRKMM